LTTATVRAHAKINLDLRVLGPRADGFHELRTVFQSIALHDTITVTRRDGPFALECNVAGVPLDAANLVWRAADTLWRSLRRTGPLRDLVVTIDKRIPVEAGLGGGSADAAATLLALCRVWRVPVRPAQLTDIAAALGADVPFFLSGGTALGLGRGDEIYPLADLPRHWVVLLLPGFGVSTRDAFGWYAEERALGRTSVQEPQYVPGPWPSRAAQMINDLEPPVMRRHQEIGALKSALREAGAMAAAMSGSGSAVFGLFRGHAAAEKALKPLSRNGAKALVTRTLTRAEHERRGRAVRSR
jgi:4-diphosphocytidyl-2-C-methyl-D-erythritol kinase